MNNLLAITNGMERSAALCEMHKSWTPNMQVSVWGRGKATRVGDKLQCKDTNLAGKGKYQGDCDNCDFFMGAQFTKKEYFWGDYADACCALDLEASLPEGAK